MEEVGDGGVDKVSWGRIFDEPAITPSSIRGSPDGTMSRRGSIVYSFFFLCLSFFLCHRFPLGHLLNVRVLTAGHLSPAADAIGCSSHRGEEKLPE